MGTIDGDEFRDITRSLALEVLENFNVLKNANVLTAAAIGCRKFPSMGIKASETAMSLRG